MILRAAFWMSFVAVFAHPASPPDLLKFLPVEVPSRTALCSDWQSAQVICSASENATADAVPYLDTFREQLFVKLRQVHADIDSEGMSGR